MSAAVTITLNDEASPRLAALKDLLPSRRLMAAIGVAAEGVFRRHFRMREAEPNNMGWPKQHIWARIMRATQLNRERLTETSATITIASPILAGKMHDLHLEPKGTNHITGRPLRFLAIPLTAEAYGISPKNRNDLRFTVDPDEGPGLMRAEATQIKTVRRAGEKVLVAGKSVGGELLYRLVRHANIAEDLRALPKTETVVEAAAKVVDREVAKTHTRK